MSARRLAVIAASGALVTGGGGAAIAAVSSGAGARKTEDAILADAAKRLNVAPDKLRDALGAAEDAQLDEAVKNGDLTPKQADAIKQHRKQSRAVLGPPMRPGGPAFPHGGPRLRGPGRPGGPGPGLMRPGGRGLGLFSELAKALGLSDKELTAELRSGKTVADAAKTRGKSLDDVRAAVRAAAKKRTAKAIQDGDLTRKQADALMQRLDKRLQHLDRAPHRAPDNRFGKRHDHPMLPPGPTDPGPAPDPNRPGSFAPAPERVPPHGPGTTS